jgi:hypothetical protein
MKTANLRRAIGAAAIVSAFAATGAVAGDAERAPEDKRAVITAVSDGKNLAFQGDKTVSSGSKLTYVDATNPKKVGPHTFTLIKKGLIPESKSEMKACGQLQGVCGDIAKAHEIDLKTFEVAKPIVEVGEKGWDTSFGKIGDTFYEDKKGSTNSRTVSAEPGTTLHYFCVVHPFMKGKIKVE